MIQTTQVLAPVAYAELASLIDAQRHALTRAISECESMASAVPSSGKKTWIGGASAAFSRGLEDLSLTIIHSHAQLESARIRLERAINVVNAHVG